MRIGIAGAGAYGTALAVTLSQAGCDVTLWGRDAAAMAAAGQSRTSPRLPGVKLPEGLILTADPADLAAPDAILLAVPAQHLAGFAAQQRPNLAGKPLIACCKGIDLESLTGPTGMIAKAVPDAIPAILTGPSFADDIARGLPTALTLACTSDDVGKMLQRQLSTATLRLYRSTDPVGAELGGALKNVMAIACGACIGAGLGDSARAALMTRGFAEMVRMATALGARPETLAGLAGLGDLALTCTSTQSRNYRFGLAMGRAEAFDTGVTVEGAATAQAAARLAARIGIEMPVTDAVAALVADRITVADALAALLARPLKEE